jgi:hypothetical protein
VKVDGALTPPVVAAKVELENARALARLEIRGYKGDDITLPQWNTFGVDSYAAYMKTVSDIQAKIMSNSDMIDTELLATSAVGSSVPPVPDAIGMVIALDRISAGQSYVQAMTAVHVDDQAVEDAIKATYDSRVGLDGNQAPDENEKDRAHEELRGLRLHHSVWSHCRTSSV